MAKPQSVKPPVQPIPPPAPAHLEWPKQAKDLCPRSRLFRIHRVDAFAWQAYVTDEGLEQPIGKADLFDIVMGKVRRCMGSEGQQAYLAEKAKKESDLEAANAAKAQAQAQKAQVTRA